LKWYQSISTLPLNRFIDVVVDGNIYALVIEGTPDVHHLHTAWADIQGEHADLIGDSESKLYLTLSKEIALLKITLTQIHGMIESLSNIFYQPHLDNLNLLLRTRYTLNPDKQEEYFKTLNSAVMRSKGIKIDLDLKLLQFKAIEEKNKSTGTKYTREYFHSVLIALSNHAKFHLTADMITVYEFDTRLNDLVKYNKELEKLSKR
jgi:hypothetical protein